ncbi:Protein kinase domain-containing protein [Massilia sp. PDC64]|nr:protein kinase [Massilia sp. PDC64]SDC82576.1 Protein kinase domain-containing protein [Massilia sp. PDC64]
MKRTKILIDYQITPSGELLRNKELFAVPGFKFVRELGVGFNGNVFLAEDNTLGRQVAIKVWNNLITDAGCRALGEIKKLANIRHHNFVPVFLFDQIRNVPYAIMEYVEGQSLKKWLTTPASPLDRVRIWTQYSASMLHLYDQGIYHGDPHAGNVMLATPPHGYVSPPLTRSWVPAASTYKVMILDTGTSEFWKKKTDFEQREKKVLVEMIDRMFGSLCIEKPVTIDHSLSPKEILAFGDVLAVLFARNAAGFPQGSENMGDAQDELDYVMENIPGYIKDSLKTSYFHGNQIPQSPPRLRW